MLMLLIARGACSCHQPKNEISSPRNVSWNLHHIIFVVCARDLNLRFGQAESATRSSRIAMRGVKTVVVCAPNARKKRDKTIAT